MLSLVVPAYNEAHRVGATLRVYLGFLRARGEPFEVLVVCDGCTRRMPDAGVKACLSAGGDESPAHT